MLTGDLVRPRLRKRGTELLRVERLPADRRWLRTAADLIALFQRQVDQPRHVWEDALEAYEGERTDYIVLRGLAKVLADDATFAPLDSPLPPEELRQRVFARGPGFWRRPTCSTSRRGRASCRQSQMSLT